MASTRPAADPPPHLRLYVNVDHVATVRQARGGREPDPVAAARLCEQAGADGITAHLREDRRHIQDDDVTRLAHELTTALNLEMACTDEMLAIALRLRPLEVTLVPERRQEVTTEGGLDVRGAATALRDACARLRDAGIKSSLFIDPTIESVTRSRELGADAVELHTGSYAHAVDAARGVAGAIGGLREAAAHAHAIGLAVHAGHGLSVANVEPVAAIHVLEEVNIGHALVGRAMAVGLPVAVHEMRTALDAARPGGGG